MRAAQGRTPPRRARSMAHVAPIIAQPFARPAAHGRPPPGQCLRNRAWDSSNNRSASMREGSAQRRPSSAQRLALDKASDRLPCAASAQVVRTHERERVAPPHTAAAGGHTKKFYFIFLFNLKIRETIMATIVLKDPSLGSDTTVGERWRIRIPSPDGTAEV
ncbi:hypothetical protein F511_10905 [Dorcoceras hygrometricum]|uniref:Uncharacterized protein n=1 Tax=Dorcoceras hygrometricum TaxID=472368 RepID=A0A2Z7CSL3_9LAMI|nr:hypothetical protein F511_10905 [Dorcoceras hygrometricum]